MNSEVKTLPPTKNVSPLSWLKTLQDHYELIFAILSGIFILTGWLFTKNEMATVGVTFYILAYIIGGYAKAKEGIEDTIAEKELNVEMLMLFLRYRRRYYWILDRGRYPHIYICLKWCFGILHVKQKSQRNFSTFGLTT